MTTTMQPANRKTETKNEIRADQIFEECIS